MDKHHFGNGTFAHELWVDNKRVFPSLRGVDVEFETAGPFDWVIADEKGVEVKTMRADPHGWTSIDLPSLGLYGAFSIGFRNASATPQRIKQGDVTYG